MGWLGNLHDDMTDFLMIFPRAVNCKFSKFLIFCEPDGSIEESLKLLRVVAELMFIVYFEIDVLIVHCWDS